MAAHEARHGVFWPLASPDSSCEPLASRWLMAAASMPGVCLPAKVNTIDESLPRRPCFRGLAAEFECQHA